MLNDFSYAQPVKIEFGLGKAKNLQNIVSKYGFSKGILICDKLFTNNGLTDEIMRLTPSIVGVYSDITPNPMLSEVERAAKLLKDNCADYAVALGGGSSMDLAKFACSMVYADAPSQEYFFKRKTFSNKHIPLIAMPTTAGTGSEVTAVSVCNDDESGVKAPLNSDNFYPFMAVIDPELTLSVPPFVTATTGLDALSHALEAFWSINHQPICDAIAEQAIRLILDNIETAYFDGKDINARSCMSLGALMAGLAFTLPKTAGVHGASYPLSINYHLCHGEACAFTLDLFIKMNAKADMRVENLARRIGFSSADEMAEKVSELKRKFLLKTTLRDIGATDALKLATECVAHPLFANNPYKFTAESFRDELLKLR